MLSALMLMSVLTVLVDNDMIPLPTPFSFSNVIPSCECCGYCCGCDCSLRGALALSLTLALVVAVVLVVVVFVFSTRT